MDRAKVAIGASALIVLALVFMVFSFVRIEQQEVLIDDSQVYKDAHTYIHRVGETVQFSLKKTMKVRATDGMQVLIGKEP